LFAPATVVIPLPESPPQPVGVYLSHRTVTGEARQKYVAALQAMVRAQTMQFVYGKYFDEPTIKRTFRQGPAPLLAGLAQWE
jgi:polar amino acid transport system substrate-binding protein